MTKILDFLPFIGIFLAGICFVVNRYIVKIPDAVASAVLIISVLLMAVGIVWKFSAAGRCQ